MTTYEKYEVWIKSLALLGSAIAFIFSIVTWREQVHIKRADFLELKIKEFEDSSMLIAKSLLDSFAICDICNSDSSKLSDREMISIGSSRDGVSSDIKLGNLNEALNEALPSTNFSKQRVRLSFDKLLDFFGKLEYYLSLNLMSKDEVKYFYYYIEKSAKNDAIRTYADKYDFDLFLLLVRRLNLNSAK